MTHIKYLVICLALLASSTLLAAPPTFTLPHNQWQMISLPATPPASANTVEAILGDNMTAGGDYGQNWVVYAYDTSANGYGSALSLAETMEKGKGYWVIQNFKKEGVTLDMPANSTETPAAESIPLAASRDGSNQWNLAGNPFSSALNLGALRLNTDAPSCSDGSCDLDKAEEQNLLHNIVWTYNGERYDEKGTGTQLNPWEGFWVAALAGSKGHSLRLRTNLVTYPPNTRFNSLPEVEVGRPDKFDSYQDTAFNDGVTRTITRITNRESDKKGANYHPYPKQGSAWNSDMSLLRIDRRIYDAKTLREISLSRGKTGSTVDKLMKRPVSAASGIRWSKKKSNVLYVMSDDNTFYELTISDDRSSVKEREIKGLGSTDKYGIFSIGHDEGNIDYDDRYIVLSSTKEDKIYIFLLDIQNGSLVWGNDPKFLDGTKFDWISVSPSGKYIIVSAKGQIDLYDASNFQLLKSSMANYAGHGDIGVNKNGDDVYVQHKPGGYGGGIFAYILKNQEEIRLLDSNHGGGHISCRNYLLKGWCFVSTHEEKFREVFALSLDGSKTVRRYAQTHQRGGEHADAKVDNKYYYALSSFVNVSPDGTRVLFWSDFGNTENYLYAE
ncbi:MAG: hypothetical protein DSZ28_05590, partial [Thiothrix sp.]